LYISTKRSDDWDDKDIIIAIDSTGIKVTNRGQMVSDNKDIKKKGYLKIHIIVSIQTKEILALDITPMRKFMRVRC